MEMAFHKWCTASSQEKDEPGTVINDEKKYCWSELMFHDSSWRKLSGRKCDFNTRPRQGWRSVSWAHPPSLPKPPILLFVRREGAFKSILPVWWVWSELRDVCLGLQTSIIMTFVLDTVRTEGCPFLEKRRGCLGGINPKEQASLSWGLLLLCPTASLRPPDTKQPGHSLWSQWANPLAEVEGKEPRTTEAGIRWSHLKGNKNKSKSNKQWKGSGLSRPCQANSGKPRGERIFSEFPKVFVVLWPLHSQAVSMAFTKRENSVMMSLPFPFGTAFSASWNKSLASMELFQRKWVGRHGWYILARPDFSQRETL